MKILILGSTGMLGHMVKQYFMENNYEVVCTTRNPDDLNYFDVMENIKGIENIINNNKPDVIINCIGILNEDAEENHDKAVLVNSFLPHYLDRLSVTNNFKLVHVSTDCVFDGEKGEYTEESFKDAKSFYGKSKALGEIANNRNVTLRTSIVGPDTNPRGIRTI